MKLVNANVMYTRAMFKANDEEYNKYIEYISSEMLQAESEGRMHIRLEFPTDVTEAMVRKIMQTLSVRGYTYRFHGGGSPWLMIMWGDVDDELVDDFYRQAKGERDDI